MSGRSDERPGPTPISGPGLWVPAQDLAELAAWLVAFRELAARDKGPGASRRPRVTPKLVRYISVVSTEAREFQASLHRAAASATSAPLTSAGAPVAELPAVSSTRSTTISTAQAGELIGVSARWVRELVAQGDVLGHQAQHGGRVVWLVDRGSAINYKERGHDGRRHTAEAPG